jgi:hypothetical protein
MGWYGRLEEIEGLAMYHSVSKSMKTPQPATSLSVHDVWWEMTIIFMNLIYRCLKILFIWGCVRPSHSWADSNCEFYNVLSACHYCISWLPVPVWGQSIKQDIFAGTSGQNSAVSFTNNGSPMPLPFGL